MTLSQHELRDPLTCLGRQVRAVAHDAAEALYRVDRIDREPILSVIDRIDALRDALADRTATELYRWLSNLRQLLSREVEAHWGSDFLDDGEGSGCFDLRVGAPIG